MLVGSGRGQGSGGGEEGGAAGRSCRCPPRGEPWAGAGCSQQPSAEGGLQAGPTRLRFCLSPGWESSLADVGFLSARFLLGADVREPASYGLQERNFRQ